MSVVLRLVLLDKYKIHWDIDEDNTMSFIFLRYLQIGH